MADPRSLPADLKAIVFDLDGTLYRQEPLRRAMLFRLVATHAAHPVRGWRTFRILQAYRQALEYIRADASGDVAAAQIAVTCERTRLGRSVVIDCVERWMEREPLASLPRCVQPGLVAFLKASKARGLRLAVVSDYPVEAKLRALGLADLFDVALCAQAADVGVFKPNPRGLLLALDRLNASRFESLYVGDRVDVDAAAARAAGMPCAILTGLATTTSDTHIAVPGYRELEALLFGEGTSDPSPDLVGSHR